MAQRMRGLAALVALAALIGGVPWLLWNYFGGAPWETGGSPSQWLSSELDGSAIMSILTVVLWVAWAYFVICVAVEAVRAVQHRPAPAHGVGAQPMARRLVATVLLLVGTAGVSAPVATAATTAAEAGQTAGGSHTIAASYVGTSARLQEAGGSASQTIAGGSEALRSDALTTKAAQQGLAVYVHPPYGRNYDCLWDIAERVLGDGARWPEIYALNKGVLQDDGNRLIDPDLIYPGWRMLLPDDASGPGVIGPHGLLSQSTDGTNQSTNESLAAAGGQSADSSVSSTDAMLTSPSVEVDHSTMYAQLGLGGGLLAAALLWGLRRQRGWNGGDPPGRGAPFEAEHRLRLHADRPAVIFADRAMRALGRRNSDGPAVRPSTARLGQERLIVRFDGPPGSPPLGWRAGSDQYEWSTTPDALRELDVDRPSAAPQLVCIGVDEERNQILVNLAAAGGVVSVSGDRKVSTEMARSIVVDLATHAWADVIEVLAVGFDEDLAPLGGGRIRQLATIEDAIAHVRGTVQHQSAERVIVSAVEPTGYDAAALVGFATDRNKPIGVLICGNVERAGLKLSVNADGVVVPAGWGMALRAQRLSSASIPPLVALYGQEPADTMPETADAIPGFDPRLADLAVSAVADVRLLGPLSIQTAGIVEPERQPLVTELVTTLAMHPAGVHQRVLEGMLWPRGASEDVVTAALEHAKKWLTGPDGVAALRRVEGRWLLDLSRVRVDWHILQMSSDGSGRALEALRMVRGIPLNDLPAGRYSWVTGDLGRQVSRTIVETAEAAANEAVQRGDTADGTEALRLGLRGVPDAEVLWRRLLRLSAADGATDDLIPLVDEMFETLERYGSPRGPEGSTLALVDDLVPGHPRSRSLSA